MKSQKIKALPCRRSALLSYRASSSMNRLSAYCSSLLILFSALARLISHFPWASWRRIRSTGWVCGWRPKAGELPGPVYLGCNSITGGRNPPDGGSHTGLSTPSRFTQQGCGHLGTCCPQPWWGPWSEGGEIEALLEGQNPSFLYLRAKMKFRLEVGLWLCYDCIVFFLKRSGRW